MAFEGMVTELNHKEHQRVNINVNINQVLFDEDTYSL